PEFLCALAIEFQLYRPPFVAVVGVRTGNTIATQVRLPLYQQTLGCRFFILLGGVLVVLDFVLWRHNLSALVNRGQPFAVVRVNQSEFELGYFRQLLARLLDFGGIESRNLNQYSILADGTDDWFARAEVINAFADDFDCLIQQSGRNGLVLVDLLELDQKRSAAFDVESQGNLLFRRPDRSDTECN